MRVIAGKYKGRLLQTVADLSVRPATSRVKGSIFNILQNRVDWTGMRVLDLFAGSGSLGIEALSRGAQHVVFVENSKRAATYLEQNISFVDANVQCEIVASDVFDFISRTHAVFDIVFADPPYKFEILNRLPSLVFESGVVSPDGYLIIEHPQDLTFERGPLWQEAVVRKYGRTVVTFFESQRETRP
jgi:16S rRNA (guanine(966)-N(2))-methyltransferase RsmD